jgi:dethiobiotin synthetase
VNTRYLYVMGAGSGAGKSAVCQGILAQALVLGLAPDRLAYIKPVTQCVEPQEIARFCAKHRIPCLDIGRLIFRNGFTKEFIDGEAGGADQLRTEVLASVLEMGKGRSLVVVDGVGDPAVGSVAGASNVEVAAALPCKVIFVGRPGIGAAIDNTVLCVGFMQGRGIRGIGLIYNKIPLNYLAETRAYVSKRLPELLADVRLLGFIGLEDGFDAAVKTQDSSAVAAWFGGYVEPVALFRDWLGAPDIAA